MDKLSFNVFMLAIEQSTCNDAIKHIVKRIDKVFRSGECECKESDWPLLAALIQRKKDTGNDDLAKKIWRVTFVDGKHCAMISMDDIDFNEALRLSVQRFDYERVLTVD